MARGVRQSDQVYHLDFPTNAGQDLVIAVAVMAAQPLPVLPVQALWINMTTAVLLGLALAFKPREPGAMQTGRANPQWRAVLSYSFSRAEGNRK